MRSVAINIGANTNEPGFRGPIFPDGTFEYIPIPETEPIHPDATVHTYGELELQTDVSDVSETPVHLDPTFSGVHGSSTYTYGDPHGVKARPLLELQAGDVVFFYATLSRTANETESFAPWITPRWGAYVIGQFRLARDPIDGNGFFDRSPEERARFSENAHLKRDPFDASVLLYGNRSESMLYDLAIPLSSREAGVDANRLVTELSSDSGKGPWWRRPMKFGEEETQTIIRMQQHGEREVSRL